MTNAAGARGIGHTYETADLKALDGVVDTVIGEIVSSSLYLSEPGQTEALRLEVAAAVFAQTETGDCDPARLTPRIRAQFRARIC